MNPPLSHKEGGVVLVTMALVPELCIALAFRAPVSLG